MSALPAQVADVTPRPVPAREHEFGALLVAQGLLKAADLQAALAEQAREAERGHWVLLGEVLQRWNLITDEQLERALVAQALEHQQVHFAGRPHPSVTSVLKRSMDIAGALVGLGLTAAVFPWVAGAITLEDDGPILFRQSRVGLHGRQFGILKFRTMIPDADVRKAGIASDSPRFFSATTDRRITRVGKVLRKTLLDELPQFWNVLVGEMSLVGTRPPTLDEVWHYDDHHWSRLGVKAGMTGMWQVCEDRHAKSFEDVVRLDLEYHRRWSLALDVPIIARTALGALEKLRHA